MLLLPLAPAFYDFDPAQIANNGAYIRWLEQGRGAWLATSPWPLARCIAEGIAPLLRRTEIDYLRALKLGEAIALEVTPLSNRGSEWVLGMRFVDPAGGKDYASARQTGCFVNLATHKPIRMPVELREWMGTQPPPPAPPPT